MFNMPLIELLPTVSQLTHQDKLRLIHFLLLAVAKEEGCSLDTASNEHHENMLMKQLAVTNAVVWSPQADHQAVQALSQLLVAAQGVSNA
jgi:ABC-type iron transport system FetAB ATPase subunit